VAAIQAQIPWNNPHWHPAPAVVSQRLICMFTDPLHISLPLYHFLQTAGPYSLYHRRFDERGDG